MCFDTDSRPPIAPMAGGALDSELVTLTSGDGTPFAAYFARAAEPSGAGIVLLPDVRGLHPYYEELALRFAERGIDTIAIDYFGRTAGVGRRGADFEHLPHAEATTYDELASDLEAAVDRLRADGRAERVFVVGFCFGGRLAFVAATMSLHLAGVIGFYGRPVGEGRGGVPAPAERADRFAAPVLGLFGGGGAGNRAEDVAAFDAALARAGVPHRLVTYPGAPHSFFDRKAAEFAEASEQAWAEVLRFVEDPDAAVAA